MSNTSGFKEKRLEILGLVLKEVPYKGWNNEAILAAAKKSEKELAYFELYFPNLISDMMDLYLEQMNEEFKELLLKQDFNELKVREKIAKGIWIRFQQYAKHKLILRKNVDYFFLPQNINQGRKAVWEVCNMIWRKAGDKSTDYNYYSKRTLLAGVYMSSLLFFIEDESKDHIETKEFIDRRIEEVLKFGNVKGLNEKITKAVRQVPFVRLFFVNGFFGRRG